MTRRTNARIAGFTFLAYIAAGVADMALNGASGTQGTATTLAHTVISLLTCFAALVLAVTLYAVTRDQDRDLALLALTCRVGGGCARCDPREHAHRRDLLRRGKHALLYGCCSAVG